MAEILFTTGTTGKSKGIEVTFKTDIAIAQNVIDSVEMGKDEVELLSTPINHSLAIRRFYGAMYNGSTAILTDGFVFVELSLSCLIIIKLQLLHLFLQY